MESITAPKSKLILLLVPALFCCALFTGWSTASRSGSLTAQEDPDSVMNQSKAREVLTGQKLFVVKLSKNSSKDSVKFEAELRDAFMIVSYEGDSSSVAADWTMCTKNACPQAGVYPYGSAQYGALNKLIAAAKAKKVIL